MCTHMCTCVLLVANKFADSQKANTRDYVGYPAVLWPPGCYLGSCMSVKLKVSFSVTKRR